MKTTIKTVGLLAAAMLTFVLDVHAQSVDALLDKLVDKGVLTPREAKELRQESDKDFTKAYSVKSGMPEWVSALKFTGDMRGRYESFYYENPAPVDRHRFRYRLRFGVTASLFDDFEAGFRLTSAEAASGGGSGGDPISPNATLQDNGSKKFVYLDLAYAKWSPIHTPDWAGSFIIGKMENPFVFSDMLFDQDYTPEGGAMQLAYNFNSQHTARFSGGVFALDEISGNSSDPYMYGGQLRLESKWNAKWSSSFGVAMLAIANNEMLNATRSAGFGGAGGTNIVGVTTWTVPNQNGGNLRSGLAGFTGTGGNLLNELNPIIVDGAVTYTMPEFWHYKAPFPIRLAAEYMNNPAANTQNEAWSVGVTFGKSGKKGLWELSYRYKLLGGDAWFEEVVDSDFGAYYQTGTTRTAGSSGNINGTNVKGHIVRASYSPFDSFTLGITAFVTELIQKPVTTPPAVSDSGTTRLQMDAVWKF